MEIFKTPQFKTSHLHESPSISSFSTTVFCFFLISISPTKSTTTISLLCNDLDKRTISAVLNPTYNTVIIIPISDPTLSTKRIDIIISTLFRSLLI